jgi:hypothetical protein
MSSFSQSKFYPDYKRHLTEFSICMRPVLEASYERLVQNLPQVGEPLDNYCLAERNKVEELRKIIRSEFKLQ